MAEYDTSFLYADIGENDHLFIKLAASVEAMTPEARKQFFAEIAGKYQDLVGEVAHWKKEIQNIKSKGEVLERLYESLLDRLIARI